MDGWTKYLVKKRRKPPLITLMIIVIYVIPFPRFLLELTKPLKLTYRKEERWNVDVVL
jgi:hypothetical protein